MGPSTVDRMSPLDATFLYAEDGTNHMHIGSCAVFEGPSPSLEALVTMVESKLHLLPRYRQRVRFVPAGLGHPVWMDDPELDIRAHVRRTSLPAGGGDAELERLMARLMSEELDRRRPLWEAWLVTGLPGDRWALISKVHHCMVDGISGTGLMAAMLDADRDGSSHGGLPPASPDWTPARAPTATELTLDALGRLVMQPARVMAGWVADLGRPKRTWARVQGNLAGLGSLRSRIARHTPKRSIEGTIGRSRSWAVARCELADLKAIRSAFGGSVNDVALAVVTAAFRQELLTRHDGVAPTDVMRALVPVSRRAEGDRTTNNQVSMMIAELPIGCDAPLDRLHSITGQMAALKASHQSDAAAAAFDASALVPPAIVAATVKTATAVMHAMPQHLLHTVVTNVPGPQLPLYAMGREMVEYLPFVPVSEGIRIGVAVLSYHGRVAFGLTGDLDSVPELRSMAEQIEGAVAELVELAGAHT